MKITVSIIVSVLTIYSLYTDLKRREIDDWVSIVGVFMAILITILGYNTISITESIIGGIFAFAIFYILPIGGGDMKFLTFIGFLTGVKGVLLITFLSSLFTIIFGIGFVIKNIKDTLNKEREAGTGEKLSKRKLSKEILHVEVPFMIGITPAVLFVIWFTNNPYIQNFYSVFDSMVKNIRF